MDNKKKSRFDIKQQLGEGSFSKIFKAYDRVYNRDIALKVEKEDKSKKILKFEYDVLKDLQDIPSIPKVYEFVENSFLNFFVLELLGKNISELKKSRGPSFTSVFAYDILIQMLNSIQFVHEKGYIHRDIKPSNFVICQQEKKVYLVDFGLAKLHLNRNKEPFPQRKQTDFRGTVAYASLNAHNKIDLSRRDDLWSFFFVILDLLNERLPWRNCSDDKQQIEKIKKETLDNAEKELLINNPNRKELFEIFYHLKSLRFCDKPNYEMIRNILQSLLNIEMMVLTISQEKTFASSCFSSNYNYNTYFNIPIQNDNKLLLNTTTNNDLNMLYPIYLYDLYNQLNQLTKNFFFNIQNVNYHNELNILGKKRERTPEKEEVKIDFSIRNKKNEGNFKCNSNYLAPNRDGLNYNNSILPINLSVCNIDNYYNNLFDNVLLKMLLCSSYSNRNNSCLGQDLFNFNNNELNRPVFQR